MMKLRIVVLIGIMSFLLAFAGGTRVSAVEMDVFLYLPLVRRSGWAEVGAGSASGGGISGNEEYNFYPAIAAAPDGTPYVAWEAANSKIFIRRWNGSAWEEVGAGSASGGGIGGSGGTSGSPAIAISPAGTPYVAWEFYNFSDYNREIFVLRWNGSAWEEVGPGSAGGGGISDTPGFSSGAALAIAPGGTPYVAWYDNSSGNDEIYVRRWNGSTWEEVGAGSAGGGGISGSSRDSTNPKIAIAPNGRPFVLWSEYEQNLGKHEIYIKRWNGASWIEVGAGSAGGSGVILCPGSVQGTTLAISPSGVPFVAYGCPHPIQPNTWHWDIYVLQWTGGSWEEVGPGSASGGGISGTIGKSVSPSIAFTTDEVPIIAWEDGSNGPREIYVRSWNGSSWVEVGMGSATGGGISSNPDASRRPAIGMAPDGTPYVTWHDASGEDWWMIFVRRFVK